MQNRDAINEPWSSSTDSEPRELLGLALKDQSPDHQGNVQWSAFSARLSLVLYQMHTKSCRGCAKHPLLSAIRMQGMPSWLAWLSTSPLSMQLNAAARAGTSWRCRDCLSLGCDSPPRVSPHRVGARHRYWYEPGSPQSYALNCGESLTEPARLEEARALKVLHEGVLPLTLFPSYCSQPMALSDVLSGFLENCSPKGLLTPVSARVRSRLRQLAVVGLGARMYP